MERWQAKDLDKIIKKLLTLPTERHLITVDSISDHILKGVSKEEIREYFNILSSENPAICNKVQTSDLGAKKEYGLRPSGYTKRFAKRGGYLGILNRVRNKEIKKNIYKGTWDLLKIAVGLIAGYLIGRYLR